MLIIRFMFKHNYLCRGKNLSHTRHNWSFMSWGTILLKHNSLLPRLYSDLCLNINRIMPSHICRGKNTINSYLRRVYINSIYAVCVTCWLSVCPCVRTTSRPVAAPGSRVKIKMATSGDGSVSLIQLLRRISQTVHERPGFSSMAFPSARRRLLQGKHLSRQLITCDVIFFAFIPWPCHRIMPCTYE